MRDNSPIKSDVYASEEEHNLLVEVCKDIIDGRMSRRDGAKYLEQETGKSLSHTALNKKVTQLKLHMDKEANKPSEPEKPDWEVNPDNYLKDDDGNFLLTKAGKPKKRPGQKKGGQRTLHSTTKKKMQMRKKYNERKRQLERRRATLQDAKYKLSKKKEALEKYDAATGNGTASTVVDEKELDIMPNAAKEELLNEDQGVAFKPNPGPQVDFLASPEKDVLYGGAAGGGKSYAMIVDPLRYAHRKAHRFLILRKTLGELGELIDKSKELYPIAFPGAKWKEQKRMWEFPSGAKGFFGYLDKDSDVLQYQGREFSWIGFDEITHLPTEYAWNYLASRLRTVDKEIIPYMRCTANPGGPGHAWVKKRYVDPAPKNTPFGAQGITRRFIPAMLKDNPYLYEDGQYEIQLKTMSEVERRRLLEGDWEVAEGAAFPEFDRSLHIIAPMDIPMHWERLKSVDYGYAAPSAVLWGAVDPEDGTVIIYRELYQKGLEPSQLAQRMTEMEKDELRGISGVIDGQCFARTGHTGPTQAETLIKSGHKLRRADKNREAGKIQIHEFLRPRENGKPKLIITNNCVETIRELVGIPLDDKNPEDVDTHADDHAYDALRYLIMSRPRQESVYNRMARYKSEIYMPADPVVGY